MPLARPSKPQTNRREALQQISDITSENIQILESDLRAKTAASHSKVKVTKVGNSMGVIIPKETLRRLQLDVGDTLHIIENKDGITLSPYDPEFEQQMEVARAVMKKRRAVLHELAK